MNLDDLSAASPFLASDDYIAGTVLPVWTIERITMAEVPVPGKTKKDSKGAMYFAGVPKGYVINKNVARAIAKVFGTDKDIDRAWIGGRIQLEIVADVRRPDGTRGNAFRLHQAWAPEVKPVDPWLEKCRELGPKVKAKIGADAYALLKSSHEGFEATAKAFEEVLNAP